MAMDQVGSDGHVTVAQDGFGRIKMFGTRFVMSLRSRATPWQYFWETWPDARQPLAYGTVKKSRFAKTAKNAFENGSARGPRIDRSGSPNGLRTPLRAPRREFWIFSQTLTLAAQLRVDHCNVGMVERCQELCFAGESGKPIRVLYKRIG